MNMKIQTIYLLAGLNQTNRSFDWNPYTDLIAYSASNRIILYDIQECCVVGSSAHCHEKSITFVEWIKNDKDKARFLLTASSDGSAKLWEYISVKKSSSRGIVQCLKPLADLNGHNGSIACASAAILQHANEILVATSADDFLIKTWKVNINSGHCQVFDYKLPGRSLALDIIIIPSLPFSEESTWPFIVFGGDDSKVHVMTTCDGNNYKTSYSLSGHQDWVTTLSYKIEDSGDLILASGSKDGMIRLWRMSHNQRKKESTDDVLEVKTFDIKLPRCKTINSNKDLNELSDNYIIIHCVLESVLHGHEGLVSSLHWDYFQGNRTQRLLSCAKTEDRSVVIWEPQIDEGVEYNEEQKTGIETIWVEKARLGEVGGNREGFFSAQFGPDGKKIVAVSYQGGLHLWHYSAGTWVPHPVVSGHFDEVVDLDWDSGGRYLMTASKDQTSRLHAPWVQNSDKWKWQEIARPQVHGYDMACITCLDGFRFASAGEEKVVRGFTATKNFVRRLQKISNLDEIFNDTIDQLPTSATVPSLGLSNKGESANDPAEGLTENIASLSLEESENCAPPTEDELMMGTLWPEVSKLYGHGNELLALTSSHDSSLLASSCRATNDLDAKIILWNTKHWKEDSTLSHHRLSVTQLEFSTCDQYLLSVSRDRSWAVWSRGQQNEFSLMSHSGVLSKKCQHSRIIWACAWVPKSRKFITGSRDKTVAIWSPVSEEEGQVISWERIFTFTEPEEVTAVAVTRLKYQDDEKLLIAIGYATGALILKLFDETKNDILETAEVEISHRKAIRRLKFKPRSCSNYEILTLASCGNDHAVMLYDIAF